MLGRFRGQPGGVGNTASVLKNCLPAVTPARLKCLIRTVGRRNLVHMEYARLMQRTRRSSIEPSLEGGQHQLIGTCLVSPNVDTPGMYNSLV